MKTISNSVGDAYSSGWVRLCTVGDYPHPMGVVQRLTDEVLTNLVIDSKRLKNKFKKWLSGWPVYKGHPDVQPQVYPDNTEVGTIIDIMANSGSLFCRLALNEAGEQLVASGLKYLSACWQGTLEGGFFVPHELLSVGLTPSPVIKTGEALANSNLPFFESFSLRGKASAAELLAQTESLAKKEIIITRILRDS